MVQLLFFNIFMDQSYNCIIFILLGRSSNAEDDEDDDPFLFNS